MLNPRLAARYAKSLIDIAIEKDQLDALKPEVDFLLKIFQVSPEFKTVMRSPVIHGDKKKAMLREAGKGLFSPLMRGFMELLINKGREKILPEIFEAFNEQYNTVKGIHVVKITTAQAMSDELREELVKKFKADTNLEKLELTAAVNEDLIGGFVLEYNNNLVDTSIQSKIRRLRQDFKRNDYLYNIR